MSLIPFAPSILLASAFSDGLEGEANGFRSQQVSSRNFWEWLRQPIATIKCGEIALIVV
jgi:hypothetical protein